MKINIFWFRRDLRLDDNAGLYHALNSGLPVLPLFIFDTDILDKLEDKTDKRIEFIFNALKDIDEQLSAHGSRIVILHGKPVDVLRRLIEQFDVSQVFANHDYEPYAIKRDNQIAEFLKTNSITFSTFKDQIIFERNEVTKSDGKPYTVFTPFSKAWKAILKATKIPNYASTSLLNEFYSPDGAVDHEVNAIEQIGFNPTGTKFPARRLRIEIIKQYDKTRDYPAIEGTSRLSVHLRFGTISIRSLLKEALKLNETWLNELIWREFFMMILYQFPHVVNASFKPAYDRIEWRNNENEFEAWCNGMTGYPIVDAGMRELNHTGYMHNRVRMITASFLCKHLLVDWRWGETYFASKLLDYELSSNNGNWQWASGSGCDAAPYFRVFNPELQTKRFDPKLEYISKWVPELSTANYPAPIVEHTAARERALRVYKAALHARIT